ETTIPIAPIITPITVATAVSARTIPPVMAIAFCTGPGNELNPSTSFCNPATKAVADLNRFENELKQVNRQAEQKGMDKLNNSLKSLQAEFQSITTGMGGFS
ncbi:hypothetical protein ACUOA8_51405, partial [Escherichia sp. SS-MK2]